MTNYSNPISKDLILDKLKATAKNYEKELAYLLNLKTQLFSRKVELTLIEPKTYLIFPGIKRVKAVIDNELFDKMYEGHYHFKFNRLINHKYNHRISERYILNDYNSASSKIDYFMSVDSDVIFLTYCEYESIQTYYKNSQEYLTVEHRAELKEVILSYMQTDVEYDMRVVEEMR